MRANSCRQVLGASVHCTGIELFYKRQGSESRTPDVTSTLVEKLMRTVFCLLTYSGAEHVGSKGAMPHQCYTVAQIINSHGVEELLAFLVILVPLPGILMKASSGILLQISGNGCIWYKCKQY